jgi:hypothetical protein
LFSRLASILSIHASVIRRRTLKWTSRSTRRVRGPMTNRFGCHSPNSGARGLASDADRAYHHVPLRVCP